MTLYMLVTADKYELPLAVRDSAGEIADLLGRPRSDIYSAITRKAVSQDTYNGFRYKIVTVNVDDVGTRFMAVTADKYHQPVAVADTQSQLAQILGVKAYTISRAISLGRILQYDGQRIKIVKIDIYEEDDDG